MAFVFRSKSSNIKSTLTPGPGQYRFGPTGKESSLSTAPFNQTSARKIWKENSLPGPGAYEVEDTRVSERAIVKNCGSAFGLFETPIESAIFKSHSKRFQNNQEDLPGPGQYSLDIEKIVKQRTTSQSNSLYKYLQKSRTQNMDKEVGLLAIGEEEEKVRDSSAHSCHVKKDKKVVPFDSQEQRCKPVRPQTSLGPGSYEISQAKQQKQCLSRKKVTQSITKFKKMPPEDYRKELEIKQNFEESKNKAKFTKTSYNSKKDDFFGSTVSRFANGILKDNTPGPGEYELASTNSTSNLHIPHRKPVFGRSSQDSKMMEIFVSPFQVKDTNKDRPKTTKKKLFQGCFVFKEARFKEAKANESTDINNLASAQLFLGKQDKQNKNRQSAKKQQKHSSKLLIKREIIRKPYNDDRPLSYASQAYTISAKNKEKCQINAPFLSYATRFNENTVSASAEFQTLYCQNAAVTEYREKEHAANVRAIKTKGVMDSTNPRFNYQCSDSHLSPFTYDPVKPKSKQFNRLFL